MATALLDADIVAFRAAAVSEQDIDWNDGCEGKTVSHEAAASAAVELAKSWTKKADATNTICCFSPKEQPNFRRHLYAGYKAHRTGEKPAAYWSAVEALEAEFKCIRIDNLEADDVMGIYASDPRLDAIVVTIDKDLQGVPCRYFNPVKPNFRTRTIRPQIADYYWLYQTLIGDSTDGYKGCHGIGPVKARAILDQCGFRFPGMWAAVVATFQEKKLTENDAILQARLARILRADDYDNTTNRIRLWHPNSFDFLSLPLPSLASTPTQPEPVSQPSPASSRTKGSRRSSSRASSKR